MFSDMAYFIHYIIVILGLFDHCLAIPISLDPLPMESDRPALGFPSQYLPPITLQTP